MQESKIDPKIKKIYSYTDGSGGEKSCGYAFIMLEEKDGVLTPVYEEYGNLGPQKNRQISGEIEAAIKSIKWCIDNSYNHLVLCYDYTGIGCWPTGVWKAKDPDAKRLVYWYGYALDCGMQIDFQWERGHQKDSNGWNNRADELATLGKDAEEIVEKVPEPFREEI
jgi:ribonuclease HI